MSNSPYIIAVTAQNFATEVIEKSNQVPVLVDFWAEWCAPCKMLMPILTQLAEEYQGQFLLAKLNTEEEKELATQYGIRSIPTLKLFRHGQVVEETMGAQSETVLRDMINRHRERPANKLRLRATAFQMSGQYEKAVGVLEQALEMEPTYHLLKLDLAKNLIHLQRFDEAELLLKELPPNINVQAEAEFNELMAHFMFSRVAAKAPAIEILQTTLADKPDDLMVRYQLSARQVLNDDYEAALENLLELMRRNRKFEEDAGRKGMLAVFTLLGNQGPIVNHYRGKMTALLY